eukprot:5052652-Amphidinium_carterae.1
MFLHAQSYAQLLPLSPLTRTHCFCSTPVALGYSTTSRGSHGCADLATFEERCSAVACTSTWRKQTMAIVALLQGTTSSTAICRTNHLRWQDGAVTSKSGKLTIMADNLESCL